MSGHLFDAAVMAMRLLRTVADMDGAETGPAMEGAMAGARSQVDAEDLADALLAQAVALLNMFAPSEGERQRALDELEELTTLTRLEMELENPKEGEIGER